MPAPGLPFASLQYASYLSSAKVILDPKTEMGGIVLRMLHARLWAVNSGDTMNSPTVVVRANL